MLCYKGHEIKIDDGWVNLSEEELHALYACDYMVDNKLTIRETAKKCGYSGTTFWRRIHCECKALSPKLYKRVKGQMKENRKRRRK